MPAIKKQGLATIVWGTDNMLATPAGAIIESGKITPKNGAPIEIEDNNGFAISAVILDDGFDAKFSLLYDTAKAYPDSNAKVVVNLPNTLAANGNSIAYNCWVGATPELDQNRKKEAMISFTVLYRPGITPA
jgi:hypothetical protein